MSVPVKLQDFLETLDLFSDRSERIQYLISLAEGFEPVKGDVASPPFPEADRVQGCESEAFVFSTERPDGRLDFHFAVQNPQGLSAMALSAILQSTVSGAPLDQVAAIPDEIVYQIFGSELSMGKSMGLTGIVQRVRAIAKKRKS